MANIFIGGDEIANQKDLNRLLVNENTPQLSSGEDLNNFFIGFKTCENVPLKNSPLKDSTYAAVLGLKINNGVFIQIFLTYTNQIFMRSYKFNGNNDFVWDKSWTQIGGITQG